MLTLKVPPNNIYLDTNIILDYIDKRDNQSTHLLETIRRKKWKCSSSVFTMMELCDVKKDQLFFHNTYVKQKWTIDRFLRERYKRNLSPSDLEDVEEYVKNINETLRFIDFLSLSEDGWNLALLLCATTILRAPDCIQLATAITLKCTYLVTKDEILQKVVNITNKESKEVIIPIHTPITILEKIDE
jgi:predicted nucleic acid-binding protein